MNRSQITKERLYSEKRKRRAWRIKREVTEWLKSMEK
jgi:hypothetical protein